MSGFRRSEAERRALQSTPLLPLMIIAVLWACGGPEGAQGQEPHYSVALRGVSLAEALQHLVRETAIPLIFESDLVEPYRAYCVIEDQPIEAVLRCLLKKSPLDFVQLSSGTYVIKERLELEAQYGYLAGLVRDREAGMPVSNTHVLLRGRGIGRGAVTNRAGQFVFPALLPGTYTISTSHVSYENWRDTLMVVAEQPTHMDIVLAAEPVLISPIMIDGLQHRPPAEALDHEQLGLDANAIGYAAGSQGGLTQQMGTLMGVRVSDVTADVHVQGGDAGAHQFRLDGVPVFLPQSAIGFISPFSTFALDRLRVYKAGFGVRQGSQTAGVIQAEHTLEAQDTFNAQVDVHSLNAQVQRYKALPDQGSASFMAAARVGLWDLYQPHQLRNTLTAWSAPDPFVLFGPVRAYPLVTSSYFQRGPFPARPDLSLNYTDLHAAARIQATPLRTLNASGYYGRMHLDSGSLSESVSSELFPEAFSIHDNYNWRYAIGQISYNAVVSRQAMASAQLRGSTTRLDHRYTLSFGFDAVLDSLLENEMANANAFEDVVDDQNQIREFAAETTLDYAHGAHYLQLGAEVAVTRSDFDLLLVNLLVDNLFLLEDASSLVGEDSSDVFFVDRYATTNVSNAWRLALYAEDRITIHRRWQVEVGLRATYLHKNVYAEPRASLRYDYQGAEGRAVSLQTTAGLYRQFVNQIDISALNAGETLPATRIWLPVDRTMRPPKAWHFSQALLWVPHQAWQVRLEGYFKLQRHGLAMNYASASVFTLGSADPEDATGNLLVPEEHLQQEDFLTPVRSRYYGVNMAVAWEHPRVRAQVRYAYSHARQTSDVLFGGRTVTTPWNEPHRVDLSFDWLVSSAFTASVRGRSIWGRTWGFRRAYYDYFGHKEATRTHGDFDFGTPSRHVLPPLYQVDLGLAYTRTVRNTLVQVRLDVLNVFDRENIVDWRLVYDEAQQRLVKAPRPLYGMMPVLAVRIGF